MNALILMTRVPIPGRTKTRLMDIFSPVQCAEIHYNFLLDLFEVCNKLKNKVDIYLTYTPEESISIIKDIIPEYISIFPQQGESLGDRMSNAINKLLENKYKKVILIGSDIPEIQPYHIEDALNVLENKDICFGPTLDGGYYLVGMKESHKKIFCNDISWGEKTVLERTIDIANSDDLTVGLTYKCTDIDTKEDIDKFMKKIKNNRFDVFPHHTVKFIEKYWGDIDVKACIER